jgi:L-lactate dehydrogenase (cytochrome)
VPVITHIEDLRVLAKKRVPRMFYDYADSGSWTESTYRANETDFNKILLRQRVAVNMEGRTTRTTMLGQDVAMPVAIAPTGLTGMQHADGEILGARAAKKFGIPFTLSTMSICSIEDIAQATDRHPFWFQLYVMRDRDFIERLIDRAKAANCSALVITLDLQILGQRHKDIKNGLSAPPKLTIANILNLMSKPRWCLGMLGTTRRQFGNIVGHVKGIENMGSLSEWTAKQFDPALSWADVEWIKKRWGGKIILKGIQDVEDARTDRFQPWRTPTRWRAIVDRLPAGHRRCGGQPDRGPHGRRHPLRPGRAQGARTGRTRHLHRARLPLRPGRHGRSGGDQGPGDHP